MAPDGGQQPTALTHNMLEVFVEFLEQYEKAGGQLPPTKESVRRFFKCHPNKRKRRNRT